jgi:hypothetical protein
LFILFCPHPIWTSHFLEEVLHFFLRGIKSTGLVVVLAVGPKISYLYNKDKIGIRYKSPFGFNSLRRTHIKEERRS